MLAGTVTPELLRRLPEAGRTATLFAAARALGVSAVDDALDVFAVLMTTKLIGAAERASAKDRLRSLPQLRQASVAQNVEENAAPTTPATGRTAH